MDPMEEDRVFYKSNDVKLNIDKHTLGLGCLIISESKFCWQPNDKDFNISLKWAEISLHAIQLQPIKRVYIMLDFILHYPGKISNGHLHNDEDEPDSECEITELWLEPNNVSAVDDIFATMKHCQSLHPDPSDLSGDEAAFDAFDNGFDDNMDDEPGIDEDLVNMNLNEDEDKFADAFE